MKRVNSHHSKFIDSAMDEDDDFARPASYSAKQKKKGKAKLQIATQPMTKTSEPKRKKKERPPPEDELYKQELQLALVLSAEEAAKSQSSTSSQQSVSDDFISHTPPTSHHSPPCLDRVTPLSINKDRECEDAPHLKSELIDAFQVISESDPTTEVKPRNRGVKRPKYAETSSGSDDESVLPSGDSLSDDSDDSSFSCRKSTKRSKKTVSEQKPVKSKTPAKHKNIKPHSDKPLLQPEKSALSTSDGKPLVERNNITVKELVAHQNASPALLRSPISCSIRLGLSKKARVKPLHPSVNIVRRSK